MIIFCYDKTFEGLLSAVFDAFKLKKYPEKLFAHEDILPLFTTEVHYVETRNVKYQRVESALKKRVSKLTLTKLTYVWLSEQPESDLLIFRYLCKLFHSATTIETDFADEDVLNVLKLAKKVSREKHRMMQFVRFNQVNMPNLSESTSALYFAVITPIYNVLPLVIDFFQDRFADQQWVIYDEKRSYGYFYDLHHIQEVSLSESTLLSNGCVNNAYLTDDEKQLQTMWRHYCHALTIKARINPKLQKQFMPKRFWRHLPEMWHH